MNDINWVDLYGGYRRDAYLPDVAHHYATPQRAVFRGLEIDLAQVKETIGQSGAITGTVVIYADVLMASDVVWLQDFPALQIYARRVECRGNVTIGIKSGMRSASIIIYSDEWTGSMKISAQDVPDKAIILTAESTAQSAGVAIRFADRALKSMPMDYTQGIGLEIDEDMYIYFSNLFAVASAMYGDHPEIALSVLLWVKKWTAFPKGMEMIYYRSLSLANQLWGEIDASQKGSRFVPYLTSSVYKDLADSFVKEIKDYENKYMQLFALTTLTQNSVEMVKSMANISKSEQNYIDSLLKQAADNYDNAQAAVEKAKDNFAKQEKIVNFLAIDFEAKGIPQYKRDQVIKAVVSMVTAVVQFGAGIASMVSGSPGGGAAAANAAVSAAEGASKAAEATKEVAETAKATADTMKKLKELVALLKNVYEFASKMAAFAKDIQKALKQKNEIDKMENLTDAASLNATAAWDAYILQVDNMMNDPITKGIEFASEYKEALDILAIYGKAVCNAQLAVIKTSQEMMAITFQLQYSKEKQEELKRLAANLQAGQEMPLRVMQTLCQRYFDGKSSLFFALKSYQSAYFYWALRESDVRPSIAAPISMLADDLHQLTHVTMDVQHSLEQFKSPPQALENRTCEITDPTILANLRREKRAVLNIPLDVDELAGLGRVRLDTIRIWLEGAKFISGKSNVLIDIENTGNYSDRLAGRQYQFTGRPLSRSFEYEVTDKKKGSAYEFADGTYGLVKLDGKVDKEVAYAYFQPTPFSEWTISLGNGKNSGLDLSGVTKIVFWFEGTALRTK